MKEKKTEKKKDLLKEREEKIKELTELCQRVQADFQNFQKRLEKDQESFVKYAEENLIKELLTVLDDFDQAKKDQSLEELKKGLELIHTHLLSILEKRGVKEIKALGETFNPALHEPLTTEKDEKKEDNTVLEEFQKGYKMNDKILRHAKVKINKLN